MSETYLPNQRRLLLACVYLLSAFWGFHSALATERQSADLLLTLIIAVVVTLFCLVDAKAQHKTIPALAGWIILVFWPIAAPICLFWVHGRRKSLRVAMSLLAVIAACFGGAVVASLIALH